MKISELISHLDSLKEQIGDLSIYFDFGDGLTSALKIYTRQHVFGFDGFKEESVPGNRIFIVERI